jgi:hypothetical protein
MLPSAAFLAKISAASPHRAITQFPCVAKDGWREHEHWREQRQDAGRDAKGVFNRIKAGKKQEKNSAFFGLRLNDIAERG